ncbi:MAG: DUF3783 domain-containing protein [Longicatena sp.]
MEKKIAIYLGSAQHKKKAIEIVLNDLKIPYLFLSDDDLQQTTGYIMQLPHFSKTITNEHVSFSSDLMILQNIEDQEIQAINNLLKALDCSMTRKAMLTEHNKKWFIKDLLCEIEKEHHYFMVVAKIRELLNEGQTLRIDNYTATSYEFYKNAFYHAYECISKDSSYEDVQLAYDQLIVAKNKLQKQT